jgi:hypothetical protein
MTFDKTSQNSPVNKIHIIKFHGVFAFEFIISTSAMKNVRVKHWRGRREERDFYHKALRQCSKYIFNHIFVLICIIMENCFGEIVNSKIVGNIKLFLAMPSPTRGGRQNKRIVELS